MTLLREIAACGDSTEAVVTHLENVDPESPAAKHYISLLSAAQLQQGRKLAKVRWMLVMSLRKDERRFWISRARRPLLIRHNLGSALPSIKKAGLDSKLELPPPPPELKLEPLPKDFGRRLFVEPSIETVTRWADSRNESAQVLYNLACCHAFVIGAHPDSENTQPLVEAARDELRTAVRLLEKIQTHPYAAQIQASWVQRDPDLEWLRSDAYTPPDVRERFDRLIALMSGGEAAQKARDGKHSS